jgi:plastocyanin
MKIILSFSLLLCCMALPALAEEPIFNLSIKDHKFAPATLEIPAGQKIKLLVQNLDKTPEEFESHELNREKVISGGSEAIVFIGPLKPGEYKFFGEFHQDTAQGKIVVK